jgi:transcriptional regulator NrdR family protein
MKCGACNGKTSVSNSRMSKLGNVRRRRDCAKCGERFTTYEVDMMEFMIYLEEKLGEEAFAAIEESLLEDFPTCDVETRVLNSIETLDKYRSSKETDVQMN